MFRFGLWFGVGVVWLDFMGSCIWCWCYVRLMVAALFGWMLLCFSLGANLHVGLLCLLCLMSICRCCFGFACGFAFGLVVGLSCCYLLTCVTLW